MFIAGCNLEQDQSCSNACAFTNSALFKCNLIVCLLIAQLCMNRSSYLQYSSGLALVVVFDVSHVLLVP